MNALRHVNDMETWVALQQLESDYWYEVDFNGGKAVHELYVKDGVFIVGDNRFEGEQGIRSFYEWRCRRSQGTTRHLISNSIVLAREGARAQWFCSVLVYQGPRRAATINHPALLADVKADCVLGDDGLWRYACRTVEPVLLGPQTPLSLSIDPNHLASRQAQSTT
jgi:SnoaL-like domain